ncbi:amidohydrolase family protein [Natronohydrobacter thiooxidans]|uniref:amidohydrolase family protein n=1 Tax=Natronohydrobacter thiooxidans TaxID=87172 RepID=UPI0008FF5359|nr:amidohydrolase family protein [Natronohydrobacter thiooxidans]
MTSITQITRSRSFALAPDLLLTSDGACSGMVVQVVDGEIAFVGPRKTFEARVPRTPITDLPDRAIIPGFIDAHTHLGQAFGKAITGGEPAQIWRRIWTPMESSYDPETVYVSAKWMFLEALRGGFTGIVNFALLDEAKAAALHQAAVDVGIRLVSSTGAALSVEGADRPGAREISSAVDTMHKRAETHISLCRAHPLITPSLCVPAVQAAPGELMRELSDYSAKNNVLFQIHTNEHHVEVHWSVCSYGKRPLEYFADHGAVGPHTLHHHCTLVTDREIEILRDTGSGVSYNPLASAWKGDRVAPALAFAARGVRFGIGTDSTRSDALRLLESAESAQRFAQGMQLADFSCGAAWTWIDAATRGSADVSGLGGVTGEIKTGLRADFLILDRRQPEVNPSWDFEWEVVRLYNRDQIEAVIIDGRTVMEHSQPVGWDATEFLETNRKRAQDAVCAAPIIRCHGPSAHAMNR